MKQSKGLTGLSVHCSAVVTVAISSLTPNVKILKSLIYLLIEFIS